MVNLSLLLVRPSTFSSLGQRMALWDTNTHTHTADRVNAEERIGAQCIMATLSV